MGSISDSIGSGKSNVRRYASIHTRRQPWTKGRLIDDFQPHLTRTPALDLAQQAQVAACNYLGYSPLEFASSIYRPQGLPSDTSRPLELHMHHHHHHYVASPTSPFSQSSSQHLEGVGNELPATVANELTIRVNSPVPANTTSTTTYPALGLHASSRGSPYLQGVQLQEVVHNQPQSLIHATSVGEVEATQRYLQNVLWLRNKTDEGPDQASRYGQEQKVDNKVGGDKGHTRKESPTPIPSQRQLTAYTKGFPWRRANERLQDHASEDDVCSLNSKSFKASQNPLMAEKCERRRLFSTYHSPYNSLSEDDTPTQDSTPALSVPSNNKRSPGVATNTMKTRIITNQQGEKINETQTAKPKFQGVVKSGGCLNCPSWLGLGTQDPNLHSRDSNQCDDLTSSMGDDSVWDSEKVSSMWTNSSCTESENQHNEFSPPRRPAKKSCAARASRRQAFREAKAWESVRLKPPDALCHPNGKNADTEEPASMYEKDFEIVTRKKDADVKASYVLEEQSSPEDNSREEKERGDAGRTGVHMSGRQTYVQAEAENPEKFSSTTEYAEKAQVTSSGTKRGLQQILDRKDHREADNKMEKMIGAESYTCYSRGTNENNTRERASHNKLREAVEAAWKTSLGTKIGFHDLHVEGPVDDRSGDVNKGQVDLSAQVCKEESLHVGTEGTVAQVAAGERACQYGQASKDSSTAKKGVAGDDVKKERLDHVLTDMRRDHENLKALVAREEDLQRELKDQTVARVAAEERARLAAEQKAHIYESSAKAAEEELRVLLDERALFHSKFKEELEQGANDRSRLQELLRLEKLKLEETENELREVRKSFQDSLALGTRARKDPLQEPQLNRDSMKSAAPHGMDAGHGEPQLDMDSTKSAAPHEMDAGHDEPQLDMDSMTCAAPHGMDAGHDEPQLDMDSKNSAAPHGMDTQHDEARLKLISESHDRIAAEAKATYFEAAAKAAEDRLRTLLDETSWFYSRFKEELGQNNTNITNLQQLMDVGNATHECSDQPRKMKLDVRSLAAPNVANGPVYTDTEDCQVKALGSGSHDRALLDSKVDEELGQENIEEHRFVQLFQPEESRQELVQDMPEARTMVSHGLGDETDPGNSEIRWTDEGREDMWVSASSVIEHGDSDVGHGTITYEKLSAKNDKKRPSSPMNISNVRQCKRDVPFTVSIERYIVDGGDTTSVFDISGGNSKFSSVELELEEPLQSSKDGNQLAVAETIDIKEDIVDVRKSSTFDSYDFAESCGNHGNQPLSLAAKWKKETKAELRRIIHEQEVTWKIAEEAVEELARRLELLEQYKMDIEDTLGRSRALGNMDCIWTRLEEKMEDLPKGFSSFYNSPIYEELKGATRSRGNLAPQTCISPTRDYVSKDDEIHELKAEVSRLRDDLESFGRKRVRSPKTKNDFQLFSQSPLPMLQPPLVVPNSSAQNSSGCETPVALSDILLSNHASGGHSIDPQGSVIDLETELPDDPFEDLKAVSTQVTENGRVDYHKITTVDRVEHCDEFSLRDERVNENRSCLPTPEENGENLQVKPEEKSASLKSQSMDCPNGHPGEEDTSGSGILSPDEGELLQVLKNAVRNLAYIFWEQDGKLKSFKGAGTSKAGAHSPQSQDLQNFYVELLKEMSHQLGQLCQDLQVNNKSHERYHHMEMVEKPSSILALPEDNLGPIREIVQNKLREEGMINQKFNSGVEEISKLDNDQAKDITVVSRNGREALARAERRLEEEMKSNLLLTEKLESGAKYLSKMMEAHVEEIARKDQSITYAQQLNIDLAKEMSQTEASVVELRSRYKGLVATLEGQLKETRNEVENLQDTANALKLEIMDNKSKVSSLEGQMMEKELQIQELKGKVLICQGETDASVLEKIELTKSLQAMRKEAEEQHRRITELISINEDLIAFSQNKENEVRALMKTLKCSQQDAKEKSNEIIRVSLEAVKSSQEVIEARKEGETYRLRCEFLKSKLDGTEQELTEREDSIQRLANHLGKTIEGQDLILEEKEQLLLSLNKAQYKEHRMDDQVRQSKITIQDLEEKLRCMDADISKARCEMDDMKARREEALVIERQAVEMRHRVHQLEEEIMEKEGQISILKASFPGEYDSTF